MRSMSRVSSAYTNHLGEIDENEEKEGDLEDNEDELSAK